MFSFFCDGRSTIFSGRGSLLTGSFLFPSENWLEGLRVKKKSKKKATKFHDAVYVGCQATAGAPQTGAMQVLGHAITKTLSGCDERCISRCEETSLARTTEQVARLARRGPAWTEPQQSRALRPAPRWPWPAAETPARPGEALWRRPSVLARSLLSLLQPKKRSITSLEH